MANNNIETLKDKGEFLFVFSDKFNILLFFKTENNQLFKITCDKYREIEVADEIDVPEDFEQFTNLKFFKPYSVNDSYTFGGILSVEDKHYKFVIEDYKLELLEEIEYHNNFPFEEMEALEDLEVVSYISKKNKVHIVGKDAFKENYDSFYGVLDVDQKEFDKIYYIYSDKGQVDITSVNTDIQNKNVYICGSIQSKEGKHPFFETFVLPPCKE